MIQIDKCGSCTQKKVSSDIFLQFFVPTRFRNVNLLVFPIEILVLLLFPVVGNGDFSSKSVVGAICMFLLWKVTYLEEYSDLSKL